LCENALTRWPTTRRGRPASVARDAEAVDSGVGVAIVVVIVVVIDVAIAVVGAEADEMPAATSRGCL